MTTPIVQSITDEQLAEIEAAADAFPGYEWDSNTEPFFNGPSGESLGGGSTGFYCVYGPPFEIDGEAYDGPTLVEACPLSQAKFICEAKPTIKALIARLRAAEKDPWQPMESCPLHQDVLFYHSRDGVYSGIKTCADTFLDDKERDEWANGEDAQWQIDCWYYGPRGVDRLEGAEVPHAWMPMPEHKDMQP